MAHRLFLHKVVAFRLGHASHHKPRRTLVLLLRLAHVRGSAFRFHWMWFAKKCHCWLSSSACGNAYLDLIVMNLCGYSIWIYEAEQKSSHLLQCVMNFISSLKLEMERKGGDAGGTARAGETNVPRTLAHWLNTRPSASVLPEAQSPPHTSPT